MKIETPIVSGAAAAYRSGASPAAGFSVPAEGARAAGPAPPARALSAAPSLEALLALQEEPAPGERRRRAVRRAGRILDVLDELKLALLEGRFSPSALRALEGAVREERPDTEDPGLKALLDQIETRAAVELAKQEMAAEQRGAAA
jgi:hypothetical protein